MSLAKFSYLLIVLIGTSIATFAQNRQTVEKQSVSASGLKEVNYDELKIPAYTLVKSGNIAYHIRDGKHTLLLKDWNYFMDFADLHWKIK